MFQNVIKNALPFLAVSTCDCPVWETAQMNTSLTFHFNLYPDIYVVTLPTAGKNIMNARRFKSNKVIMFL